jgi:signal transduction histidine kinase
MPFPKCSQPEMPPPSVSEASSQGLSLESTLADLPLHDFQVESYHSGIEVAQVFERVPLLPGVVLLEQGQFLGMISRQRLLEFLIRPGAMELFLPQPLSVLHSYAQSPGLHLPETTPIMVAAQLALRRSLDQQNEPILVHTGSGLYRLLDMRDLNVAYWQIRGIETQVRYERTQAQLIQIEKMASLGRLVDGVAHEILDPVGFIWGNLAHLSSYTDQIMLLLATYEAHMPQPPSAIVRLQHEFELDYLRQDLPQTISSIKAGADRLKKLVTSLQNFCHIDDVYPKPADLHECLDSILLLLKSRLTGEIEVVRNYGHLPPLTCYAGQLNQVFMNIITNAIDGLLNQAIRQELAEEFGGRQMTVGWQSLEPKPQILITTRIRSLPTKDLKDPSGNMIVLGGKPSDQPQRFSGGAGSKEAPPVSRWVSVQIADNGPGLSPEKCQQILDSFSVERRAAKETSLAVSYQIITAKHGGKFFFRSPVSSGLSSQFSPGALTHAGTEFEILLPLV